MGVNRLLLTTTATNGGKVGGGTLSRKTYPPLYLTYLSAGVLAEGVYGENIQEVVMRYKVVLVLVVLVFLANISPSFGEVAQINVTATLNEVSSEKTPSYTTVITNKEIKHSGAIFAKGVLAISPGVSVSYNGEFGGATSVYIRGLKSYYTKYLMDGVDISDPSLPQPYFDFSDLSTDNLSRIEIVQGSQSGLYGPSAVAGVINILTKTGKGKPSASYRQLVGSFHTYGEYLDFQGKTHNLSFYLGVSRFDTAGISKMNKLQNGTYTYGDEKDSYHRTSVYSRLEYSKRNTKLGSIVYIYKARNYLDDGWSKWVPDDAAPGNLTPQAKSYRVLPKFLMSKVYAGIKAGNISIKPSLYYVETDRYSKSIPFSNDYQYTGKRMGGSTVLVCRIKNAITTLGISYTKNLYWSDFGTGASKSDYNVGEFAELFQPAGNLNIQVILRNDYFSSFGSHQTGKAGVSYLIASTNTILKANYGTGFRAPSLYELYAPPITFFWFTGGNNKLKPEQSRSWDFGLTQYLFGRKLRASATFFKTIISDRIIYYTNPTTWKSTYENVQGNTVSQGMEGNIVIHPVGPVEINLTATYTDSKDPKNGKQAGHIPYFTASGFVTYTALKSRLTMTLNGKYVGTEYDSRNHNHQIGRYAVFNFNTSYKLTSNLETTLTVDNIFNRFYQEAYGYSTLPRSVFATVSYKF